jgi:hypothetical protein
VVRLRHSGIAFSKEKIKMINPNFQTQDTAPKKKSNRKRWLLGCGGVTALLCVIFGAIGYYLFTPSKDPLDANLSFPTTVKQGDNFDFVVSLTNPTQNPVFIKHVVFFHLVDAPFLLDGVKVIGVEPDMASDLLRPRDDREYAYFQEIKPGETQTVTFHLQADKPAKYAINLGVYAKHPSRPDPAYITAFYTSGIEIEITP